MLRDNTKVRVLGETIPYLETEAESKMRKSTNRDNDSPSRQLVIHQDGYQSICRATGY
jgi:hypothetical protein